MYLVGAPSESWLDTKTIGRSPVHFKADHLFDSMSDTLWESQVKSVEITAQLRRETSGDEEPAMVVVQRIFEQDDCVPNSNLLSFDDWVLLVRLVDQVVPLVT